MKIMPKAIYNSPGIYYYYIEISELSIKIIIFLIDICYNHLKSNECDVYPHLLFLIFCMGYVCVKGRHYHKQNVPV